MMGFRGRRGLYASLNLQQIDRNYIYILIHYESAVVVPYIPLEVNTNL